MTFALYAFVFIIALIVIVAGSAKLVARFFPPLYVKNFDADAEALR